MFRHKPTCPTCDVVPSYDDRYDAYYCAACDVWLEPACAELCEFCSDRPIKPSEAQR